MVVISVTAEHKGSGLVPASLLGPLNLHVLQVLWSKDKEHKGLTKAAYAKGLACYCALFKKHFNRWPFHHFSSNGELQGGRCPPAASFLLFSLSSNMYQLSLSCFGCRNSCFFSLFLALAASFSLNNFTALFMALCKL